LPERDNLAGRKAIKKNSTEISEAEKNNNTIRPEPSRLTRIQLKKILLIKHKIKQKKDPERAHLIASRIHQMAWTENIGKGFVSLFLQKFFI